MNKPVIWFDCDGVLLDWTRPFLEYSGLSIKYEDLTDIDLSKLYANPDDFFVHMHGYHNCMRFENLKPIVAPEAIEWLKAETGCEIHVITQLEANHIPRLNRLLNLERVFGRGTFDNIWFMTRGECKMERILSEMPDRNHIIIEDHPVTLSRISKRIQDDLSIRGKTNLTAFGVHHPYNTKAMSELNYIQHVPDTESAVMMLKETLCVERNNNAG